MGSIYKSLGHFRILGPLGRGGFGNVYLANDTKKRRQVALKLIPHGTDRSTLEAIEAERRGAQLQSRLYELDKHVAAVYGYGDLHDHFYVAMEYVEGKDLSSMISAGQIEPAQAARIAREICVSLSASHSFHGLVDGKEVEGIIHGDIKPQNVRVDRQNRIRLLDFGIAKALSQTRRLTRNEFGSTGYASPERLDSGHVDQHSDIWSVGVILYEMVSAKQPFTEATTRRLERLILSRQLPPPLPDSCPEPLRRVIMKTLAPDIKHRYQSAAALREDLDAFLAGGSKSDAAPSEAVLPTRPLPPQDNFVSPAAPILTLLVGAVVGSVSVAILLGGEAFGFEDVGFFVWLILLLMNGGLATLTYVNRAPERTGLWTGLLLGAVSGVGNVLAQWFWLVVAALLGAAKLNLRSGMDAAEAVAYCMVFILVSSLSGMGAVRIYDKN